MKDNYRTLEVHTEASKEVIEKAYKTLSKKYHPDTDPGNEAAATKKLVELTEAYSVLSDPALRARYDEARRGGRQLPDDWPELVGRVAASSVEHLKQSSPADLAKRIWKRGLLGIAEDIASGIDRPRRKS